MATQWDYGPVEFEAEGGAIAMVELRVPHRGTINSIRLHQIGGEPVDASFRIFSSRQAIQSLVGSSSSSAIDGVDPDAYSVIGLKVTASGAFEEYMKSYAYRNRDGTFSVPVRKLYLGIEPGGSGMKNYSLAMEITPAEPD